MLDFSILPPAGLHHPQVKQFLAIKNNTRANPDNLACLDGLWALSLALNANLEICSFFVCPELLRGETGRQFATSIVASGVHSHIVSAKVLAHLVNWEGPDGLAAIVKLPRFNWQHIQLRTANVLIVLDGLKIPGNIGTIIRCADGAGADGVIIANSKKCLSHPKLIRASMGSLFTFPVIETSIAETITWLKRHRFKIATTDTAAPLHYRRASYGGRVAIVLGNERNGIASEWYAAQDMSVSIPMNGRIDSLNVGNAAALMLYEVIHQQEQIRC